MKSGDNRLVWIDLEMSGLDPKHDKILEIAIIITEKNLDIIAQMETIAIFQQDAILNKMCVWNQRTHKKTGLIKRCRNSEYDVHKACNTGLKFISSYVNPQKGLLCGNSVHIDRKFLTEHMPSLESYLHYRNFDVSSFREAKDMWNIAPDLSFSLKRAHSALVDIKESIEEMKFYRDNILKQGN